MKKIIKPPEREEVVYYSDFSGKCFGELPAPVELSIAFSYGSKHDGAGVQIHLDDEELKPLLEVIKKHLSEDYKNDIKRLIDKYENDFDGAMQMRDWEHCDVLSNTLWFWRDLIGLKEEDEIIEE
jgi:hypothetical protein